MSRTIHFVVGRTPRVYTRTITDTGVGSNDNRSIVLTPGSGGDYRTPFGFSTIRRTGESYEDAVRRVSTQVFDVPKVYRYFYGTGSLTWPLTAFGPYQTIPMVVSWKPYPASSVPSGQWNTQIDNWLAKINRLTYFCCFDHELDVKLNNGTYTLQQGGAAWNYIANRVKQFGNPNVKTVFLLTGFSAESRFPQWATVINQSVMDVMGVDPYAAGATTFAQGKSRYDTLFNLCNQHFPGKMLGIGETGCNSGTDAQRAAWLSGAVASIYEHEEMCAFASYFHSTVGGDFQLDNFPQAAKVWGDAIRAS